MKATLLYLSCVFALLHAPAQAQEAPAQQFAEYDRCELVSGEAIANCRIGYRTVGTLNAARDNAILVPSWFTGTSEELVDYARSDVLDPSRYFLVLVDALANGVSSSPSNHPTRPNEAFPRVAIADMVESQHRLLTETLGIEHVHAIVGLSMGGMQAFEWAVRYPDFAERIVPIIGSPRLASYDIVRWETLTNEITNQQTFSLSLNVRGKASARRCSRVYIKRRERSPRTLRDKPFGRFRVGHRLRSAHLK